MTTDIALRSLARQHLVELHGEAARHRLARSVPRRRDRPLAHAVARLRVPWPTCRTAGRAAAVR